MRRIYLWMLAGMMLLFAGYATEDAIGRGIRDVSLTVNNVPNRQTYVSLSTHKMVGSSSLGDTHEGALWILRIDWSIAFCNEMIQTNSGSSDKGKDGITWTPVSYNDADNLRAPSYQTDTRQTVTVKGMEIE